MRVQLRDCNPYRVPWKYSRGRGRYHQPQMGNHASMSSMRQYGERPDSYERPFSVISRRSENHLPIDNSEHEGPAMPFDPQTQSHPSEVQTQEQLQTLAPASHEPLPEVTFAPPDMAPQAENYREWYDVEPSSTNTTPPPASTFSSSGSYHSQGTVPPSSYPPPPPPPPGYYGPMPPWMPPFQQMQYPMPYYGGSYPGYPPPAQQGSTSPDPAAVAPAGPNMWPNMGMYGVSILPK